MSKKILLVLNKPNREMPLMESIRREIINIEYSASVEIKEMCAPGFSEFVLAYKPDVILTFPFTCEGFSVWYYLFKYQFGCKIVSLRAEGAVDFSSEYNVQWAVGFDSYGKSLVDYELFWGDKLAQAVGRQLMLQNKLSSMDRVKIIGYPRLEAYFSKDSIKPSLPPRIKKKIDVYDTSRTILCITGFHLANYTKETLYAAKDLDAENNLEELLEAVEISKRYRAAWISSIQEAAKENPAALIIVKKHPIENKEDYMLLDGLENILFVFEDIQLDELIPYVGILFHYGSTALVDSYLSCIPSVYVHSRDNGQWYSDLGWPSTLRTEVYGVSRLVKEFIAGNIHFQMTPEIRRVLKDIFNIELGTPYQPSREIAKLLLDSSPPQKISMKDIFLWESFLRLAVSYFRSKIGTLRRNIFSSTF